MEREEWLAFVQVVTRRVPAPHTKRFTFSDADILQTYLWAVLHNHPVSWACRATNWPTDLRPARVPTPATMSRRLRRPAILAGAEGLLRHLHRGRRQGLVSAVDGKILAIRNHSRDQTATFGGPRGRQRGYRLHVILGQNCRLEAWAIHPLNRDERPVARALVSHTRLRGYLLADSNYDDDQFYQLCARRGVQLLTPRQRGPRHGLARNARSPARRRAIDLLESSHTGFGPALYALRRDIERFFGQLTNGRHGLWGLPPWIRGLDSVRRWVTAKLLLFSFLRGRRKRVR
jgi:hypothetical protein